MHDQSTKELHIQETSLYPHKQAVWQQVGRLQPLVLLQHQPGTHSHSTACGYRHPTCILSRGSLPEGSSQQISGSVPPANADTKKTFFFLLFIYFFFYKRSNIRPFSPPLNFLSCIVNVCIVRLIHLEKDYIHLHHTENGLHLRSGSCFTVIQ